MCGIVGAIMKGSSGFSKRVEDCFIEMLYADAVRGFDSTGVIAVDKWGGFSTMKEAVQASEFIPKLKGEETFKDMYHNGKAFIGHNRKKTIGEIKDETAHPFTVDKTFAMVHNGTLTAYMHLDKDAKTDSQALATVLHRALEEDNYIEALNEELGKVYGAYALAFYSQKKNKLFLLRNKERPLWILEAEDAYFFASEPLLGGWVLSRNNYDYGKLKIKSTSENVLHTYDCDKNFWKEEAITPKKAPPVLVTTPTKIPPGIAQSGVSVNKSSFKYIKKKLIGTKTYFWASDYVEEEYPKTIKQGATSVMMFAQDDEIKWRHDITTTVDMAEFGLLTEDDLYSVKWTGYIDTIDYSETTGGLIITVKDAHPMAKSAPAAIKSLWIHGLTKRTLAILEQEYKEKKYKFTDWQLEAIEFEIAKRKKDVESLNKGILTAYKDGLALILADAKKAGRHVVSEKRGEMWTWFDDTTNEVLYESSVALH